MAGIEWPITALQTKQHGLHKYNYTGYFKYNYFTVFIVLGYSREELA